MNLALGQPQMQRSLLERKSMADQRREIDLA